MEKDADLYPVSVDWHCSGHSIDFPMLVRFIFKLAHHRGADRHRRAGANRAGYRGNGLLVRLCRGHQRHQDVVHPALPVAL